MSDYSAAISALGSLASASMGSYYDKASQARAYEYSRRLNTQMLDYNKQLNQYNFDNNSNFQREMNERQFAQAGDLLRREQDYNTKFAAANKQLEVNGLRAAGLNPASASGLLIQPGVSGPSAPSGFSNPSSGAMSSGGSVPPINTASSILSNAVGDSISAMLAETQAKKNLADAGKSSSETELNEIEGKYRDKMLQQQIVSQGLQNGILDYELSYKISTYDESIKALVLSNIESLSRSELNDQQRETAAAQQKQLIALTDNLNQQTERIKQLLPVEKRELLTRAANNSAQAFLAKEMGNTEDSKRKWYGSLRNLNDANYVTERKNAAVKQFELDVKNEIGVKEYAKLEQAGINMQQYAEDWYEARVKSEIFRNIAGPIMQGLGN